MKLLYVILDGLGDSKYEELGNKTPLEYAKSPKMDELAEEGVNGIMYPIRKGIAPESDEAMFSLLGYDPFKCHTGRGVLEAIGANVPVKKNDLVLRVNFVSVSKGMIQAIEPNVSEQRLKKLANFLNENIRFERKIEFKMHHTVGHRGVLIARGRNFSSNISNSHPGYKKIQGNVTSAQTIKGKVLRVRKIRALDKTGKSEFTAKTVNEYLRKAHELLKTHQINTLLLRGASVGAPDIKKLKQKWLLLADMPVENAIGKLSGMNVIDKPTDLKETAKLILRQKDKYDCVYVQIKGPDKHGHLGNVKGKVKAIEKIDKDFFGYILRRLDLDKTTVCVTADHSTECRKMAHSGLPVPVLIHNGKDKDDIDSFSETKARKGNLGTLNNGIKLFEKLFKS